MMQTDAIVVSLRTQVSQDLAPYVAHGQKALVPLHGRPAVSYLIDSLRQCEGVRRVILASDQPGIECSSGVDICIDAHRDVSDCVLAGVNAAADAQRCLIMNGDMPLATPEALDDLLRHAPDSDVIYPIVEKSDVSEVFPGRSPFYVNTKQGQFTGSSCLLFAPGAVLAKQEMLLRLLNARDNPTELLALVGPVFAMKLMLSELALGEFESHLSRALDMSCKVFITHFPGLLASIDNASDIALMERELSALR